MTPEYLDTVSVLSGEYLCCVRVRMERCNASEYLFHLYFFSDNKLKKKLCDKSPGKL